MSSKIEINPSSAAVVCGHIAGSKHPAISYAQRDPPEEPADSGWQFFCGTEGEDWEDARVWSVGEVLEIEPALAEFIDSPPGTVLIRSGPANAWVIKK